MKTPELKKSLTKIILNLQARGEKISATYKRRREAHNIAVRLLREIKREEGLLKPIKWRKVKSGATGVDKWVYRVYVITRQKGDNNVWLGTQDGFGEVRGTGWFDDIEKAKEVVKLIVSGKE